MTPTWSTNHQQLLETLQQGRPWLIVQDLDGVCMQLVNDPLTREVDPNYVRAAQKLDGHFFVLTNGEHIGSRGMNKLIHKSVGADLAKHQGLYLPGLAAGGVQYQDRFGKVSHPGINSKEMAFLLQIPVKARYFIINLLGN
ncbi:MAG: glucosylglycerol 3-phosphatase, partial [Oceanobacter sp.]